MAKKKSLKSIHDMHQPITRQRDGALLTHWMRINLTTEEAAVLSDMFIRQREKGEPAVSLIRAALLHMATAEDPTEYLNEALAKLKVRTALAAELAERDYTIALSLLNNYKAQKPTPQETCRPEPVKRTPPTPPQPMKVRREYVPPQPRQKAK